MKPQPDSDVVSTLGSYFEAKTNSIGFMRVALATVVIVHHSFTLRHGWGRDPLWRVTNQLDLGSLAVESFLVLSGFLIAASFEKTESLPRYLWHRALRLYPGYWVCLLVSVLVLAPIGWLIEHGTLTGYLTATPDNPVNYLIANSSLWIRQTNIAQLFASHSTSYFNGSLWTLSLEATCYLAVPMVAYAGALRKRRWLVLVGWLVAFLWYVNDVAGLHPFGLHVRMFSLMKVGIYFATGVVFYAYRDKIPVNLKLVVASVCLLLLSVPFQSASVACLLAVPYLLMWCVFKLPFVNWERKADLSYGIYVYAYPVQQLILAVWPNVNSAILLAVTVGTVAPLAFLSWKFVEKPALRLKHAPFVTPRLRPRKVVNVSTVTSVTRID